MVVVAVLFIVAILAGLAFWALGRRGSDEMHSVAGYQHRLERLEEVRRRQLGSVRVIGGTSHEEDQASQPVIGESGHLEISSSSSRRRVPEDPGRPRIYERRRPPTHGPRRDMAIARMGHRPRRLGAPIAAAVAVIVLVTGLAIAGAHSRTPSSTTPTTIGHHRGGIAGSKSTTTTTTTTTTPKPTTFTATSTSGSNADYPLPFASYTVVVTATSADCYVQVTNASGQVPFAAVLHAGQRQQLTLTGDSTIVLGAPAYAQVEVDRTPVTFPSPLPAPLDLVFQATSPSSTTSTTS